jgi:hypothetical protein
VEGLPKGHVSEPPMTPSDHLSQVLVGNLGRTNQKKESQGTVNSPPKGSESSATWAGGGPCLHGDDNIHREGSSTHSRELHGE